MEVVVVSREPEVVVHELSMAPGRQLQRLPRASQDPIKLRLATMLMTTGYVRKVIHEFNEQGFGGLDPKWSSGPAVRFATNIREHICRIARCQPADVNLPFTAQSLEKLADCLITKGIVERISKETLRQNLKRRGTIWQALKTWKASNAPDLSDKMDAILALYHEPPADGHMVCVDEFGPLNVQARVGRGCSLQQHPARLRDTFSCHGGVRHLFRALDLAIGTIFHRFRDRKQWQEFLAILRQLRRRFTGKLCVICDNYAPHKKYEVTAWCATNASWLNWIESELAALQDFSLNGSDYPDYATKSTP